MKYIETDTLADIPGRLLAPGDTFTFRCHPKISCFNRCCRNLKLFLHPYDVIRLKQHLGISSGEFIETHTEVVMREGHYFPDVMLRMADNPERTCPFLIDAGCSVYPDRPQTCRAFPVEHGLYHDAHTGRSRLVHFFRPPEFCQGGAEDAVWTVKSWEADQACAFYTQMTIQWAELLRHFQSDPFDGLGPESRKAKMTFMAAYNMDDFRDFVLNSTFLKRYSVKTELRLKLNTDDVALLKLGMAWILFFTLGIPSREIRLRK